MRDKYKHPISTIGTVFFFAGIFTPLPFMMGFGLAIICWIIGKQFEDEYNRNRVINPIIRNNRYDNMENENTLVNNHSGKVNNVSYGTAKPEYNPDVRGKYTSTESQYCVVCGNKYPVKFDFCNNCGRKSEFRMRIKV